ncbi:MAG: TlpA family protein disulfide reductase [Bacteroidetes bacterium]|nr:TlpA family protein disulfide reductase [Bacteroidota bacterium]
MSDLEDSNIHLTVFDTVGSCGRCFLVQYPTQRSDDTGPLHFDSLCRSYIISPGSMQCSQFEQREYNGFGVESEQQAVLNGAYSMLPDTTIVEDAKAYLHQLQRDSGFQIYSRQGSVTDNRGIAELSVGDHFPIQSALNNHGDTVNLFNPNSKAVIVEVWHMSCVPCIESMKPISALKETYRNRSVDIVGVDPNRSDRTSPVTFSRFSERFGRTFPTYFVDPEVTSRCGIHEYPTFVILDGNKRVRKILHGFLHGSTEIVIANFVERLLKE